MKVVYIGVDPRFFKCGEGGGGRGDRVRWRAHQNGLPPRYGNLKIGTYLKTVTPEILALSQSRNRPRSIYQYSNMRGFQVKLLYLVLFLLYQSLLWELRDKRNLKNLQFWPESLGAILEYWYIERGLLLRGAVQSVFHKIHNVNPPLIYSPFCDVTPQSKQCNDFFLCFQGPWRHNRS